MIASEGAIEGVYLICLGENCVTEPASTSNPYATPATGVADERPQEITAGKQIYNVVTDTVGGINVRKSDNAFQAKVICGCLLLTIPIGAMLGAVYSGPSDRVASAVMGGLGLGFIGTIVGLFGSGIYLMIYRALRHASGKHD